jgi:glycine/D-amino acid oxidase-like deaminating enzyme/nitrite reductase/ring-hydroxylating ferredoxin subunit
MQEEKNKSIWMETAPSKNYPSLEKDIEVDVAIIGGGIVGVLIAYFLRSSGLRIAILEANKILSGTTGNTTAKATALHENKYAFLKKNFTLDGAKTYAKSNQWAIDELERIIEAEKISCDFKRTTASLIAVTDEGLKTLEVEFDVIHELDLPSSFLKENLKVPFAIKGEIRLEKQAQFHPRKFLLAIAKICERKGVRIFENSRVLSIDEDNVLETEKAKIAAKKVIIATNYPIFDKAALFLRMNQRRSYALAARFISDVPEGMFINIDGPMLTIRPYESDGNKWAIIGGQDYDTGEVKNKNPFEELEYQAREMLDIKTIDYFWGAQDSMPIDHVPYIGKMPRMENVFLAAGFGEWGMTTSFVSAKILSDLILGKENEWAKFYDPARLKPFADPKQTGKFLEHVMEGFGSYVTKIAPYDESKLNESEGKVMQDGANKVAAYKDEQGEIHVVSASCTHLGCIVNFNKAEKSWDCPCHGSRFTVDGEILNDPAIKKLKKFK